MSAIYDRTILTVVPNTIINLTILANTTGIKGGSKDDYAFKEAKDTIENVYFESDCLIKQFHLIVFINVNRSFLLIFHHVLN